MDFNDHNLSEVVDSNQLSQPVGAWRFGIVDLTSVFIYLEIVTGGDTTPTRSFNSSGIVTC